MAKTGIDIVAQCKSLISEIKSGIFKPVYLLMGEEPYYPELVCQAIIDNCIDESCKDFDETICFGADVTASQIITAARRFPMMSARQLLVVKEAQMIKDLDNLGLYTADPLQSTVLVVLLHNATVDKRKAFYKSIAANGGVVVESPAVRDYEISNWIISYFQSKGLKIDPQAAALFGESAGTELSTIVVETDKMLKNLPEGATRVTVSDIEKNIGVSRQFSIFELTKELSYRNADKALKIAAHIGSSAKFAMPMAVSALYTHFYRILKLGALLANNPYPSTEEKAKVLGVNPYFFREYDQAVRNYPLRSAMNAVSLLCEFDYKGKGGDGNAAPPDELLVELVAKLLGC